MPKIVLEHVTKRWDKFYGVDDLNLVIEDNAFVTLLGPSGCGKTTTLRMIAGLETPTSGRITIGDRVVFDSEEGINVPPNKRRVGFLFQNYALWPNMTVHDNIAFGLENVKDSLPLVYDEAKAASGMIAALARPKEIVEIIRDCVDKQGRLDEMKAQLKLLDRYELSLYSAQRLLKYNLQGEAGPEEAARRHAAELAKVVEAAKKDAAAKGGQLDAEFHCVVNGQPLTAVRRLSREEIDLAVRRVARIVKIGMFMDRYPAELSGGQQQRVAIARTLAPQPGVLFMDEPLSNLDAKLRLEMRSELQRLHLETGSTFVYVTHDQMEAMTLATRICLIDNGLLKQYDPPLTVYNQPDNTFVADFVGNPVINFINARGTQTGDSLQLEIFGGVKAVFRPNEPLSIDGWRQELAAELAAREAAEAEKTRQRGYVEKQNKEVPFRYHVPLVEETEDYGEEEVLTDQDYVIGIRPEFVTTGGSLEAEIYSSMPTGMETTLRLAVGNYLITGVMFGGMTYRLGDRVKVGFKGNNAILFDRKTGRRIALGALELS